MDVKIENERISTLCQGCLSADRKLTRITGQNKALFIQLREDAKQSEQNCIELQLCWECTALFNKMKLFQARIKTAQYRLMEYLNTWCNKVETPHTLSPIIKSKTITHYDYKYKFIHEDQIHYDEKDQTLELKDQTLTLKELTPTQTEKTNDNNLELDIKIEENEIPIKEEYDNVSIDNDTDFYETELKTEKLEHKVSYEHFKRRHISKSSTHKYSIKNYQEHATVTKVCDTYSKVSLCSETVYLSEKEIEEVCVRDRQRTIYERMPFKCTECEIGYLRRLDLLRHETFHHSKQIFPINCSACKRKIATDSQLEDHWKKYHSAMLRCNMCSDLCRSKGEMKKHLNRMHTKIYTCNNCQMEFRTLREFSNHYKKTHEKVVCDYCNSSFSSKRRLESHIKRNHLPSYCSICNRTYRTYRVFENHIRTYHPELLSCDTRKEMCYCVECDKQYPSVYRYRRHLQQAARHTPKNKIRVPCPECGKIFTRTSYMNNHYKLVHLKKSKHYCELCNKYFANGYGVRKHIQCVHQKMAVPKDKICDLCGRGFSTNRILLNHRRTHTGERPYKCQYCPASFAQDTAMKSHQRTQHKNSIPVPS